MSAFQNAVYGITARSLLIRVADGCTELCAVAATSQEVAELGPDACAMSAPIGSMAHAHSTP